MAYSAVNPSLGRRPLSDAEYDHAVFGAPFATNYGMGEEDLRTRGHEVWTEARGWYDRRQPFRAKAQVASDLYNDRQWDDYITDERGRRMSQRRYLEERNRIAVQMNIVRPVINQLVGQFRQNKAERQIYAVARADEEATEMLNTARKHFRRLSGSVGKEADGFLDYGLSGAACFRSSYERDPASGRWEVRDTLVHQTRLFHNLDSLDRQQSGLRLIGSVHHIPLDEIVRRWGRTPQGADAVARMYGGYSATTLSGRPSQTPTSSLWYGEQAFYAEGRNAGAGLPEVWEVWVQEYEWVQHALDPLAELAAEALATGNLEAQTMLQMHPPTIPQGYGPVPPGFDYQTENALRTYLGLPPLEIDPEPVWAPCWYYYFLTPGGEVLERGKSPFWHGSHPFTLGYAFWINGETSGIAHTLSDTQRWLNRLLVNIDHQMSTSPKGLITYDKTFLEGSDLTEAQMDEAIVRGDASIGLKVPQRRQLKDFVNQIKSESLAAGYFEMLPILLSFNERLTGLTGPTMGLTPDKSVTATQYERQAAQGAVAVYVYPDTYLEMLHEKDVREVRLIQQAYTEPRMLRDWTTAKEVQYDPQRAQALEFDVAMGAASDTPTQRLAHEEQLKEYAALGWISPMDFFELSGAPEAPMLAEAARMQQQREILTAALMEGVDPATSSPNGRKPKPGSTQL